MTEVRSTISSPPPVPADSWCRTRYEDPVVHHTFVWTIEQYSLRMENIDEYVKSGVFCIER
jgi:hypothetical protein